MVFLKAKTKDWKESNLMVNKEIMAFLMFANGLEPKPFTRKSFPPMCKFLIEKMSDSKFKDDIAELFEACCSCVMPKYIVLYLIN